MDAFIQNYKNSVEFVYNELKKIHQDKKQQFVSAQQEKNIDKLILELERISNLLLSILAILFSLYSYMSAGLENEKVISVCQSIVDNIA